MWSLIGALAARLALVRWLFKILGGFGLLIPAAFILKFVGLPVLAVLAVLALPVLFFLFVLGLPVFGVLLVGGAMMGLLFSVLSAGFAILKIALVVGFPLWLLWKLAHWFWADRGGKGMAPGR